MKFLQSKSKDLYVGGNEPDLGALDGYNDTTKALQQLIADAIQTNTPLRSPGRRLEHGAKLLPPAMV